LVRIVTELPLTVAVAALMTLPEVLAVGVVPPPRPYLPPLPLLLLVVGVVPDPLVVLPQAATMMTSVANTRRLLQVRNLARELKKVLCIMFSSFACGYAC
jgi:hypothetical protein